jgi:hypothetical protein
MSEHDPLCSQPGLPTGVCFECADIQTIRSDERERAVQRVEALPGYALRDTCLAAIKGDQP